MAVQIEKPSQQKEEARTRIIIPLQRQTILESAEKRIFHQKRLLFGSKVLSLQTE